MMNRILKEDYLFEMASLPKSRTGLPYDLWIDSVGVDRNNEHSNTPRLKVKVDNNLIPIEISDDPKIPDSLTRQGIKEFANFNKIKDYIKAYKNILIYHYYKKIGDFDALALLKTYKQAEESNRKLEDMFAEKENSYIEYLWNEDECLYEAYIVDEDGNHLEQVFSMDYNGILEEIEKLKDIFNIQDVRFIKN